MIPPAGPETDPGRLLRPFALARGTVPPPRQVRLDLATMVVATRAPCVDDELNPERALLLRLCARPHSIAELAAAVAIPANLTRLLVADMVSTGSLRLGEPPVTAPADSLLHAVLEGLRAL